MKYDTITIACTYLEEEGVMKSITEWEQITKVSAEAIYTRKKRNTDNFWTNEQIVGLTKLTKRPAKARKRYEAYATEKQQRSFNALSAFNRTRLV